MLPKFEWLNSWDLPWVSTATTELAAAAEFRIEFSASAEFRYELKMWFAFSFNRALVDWDLVKKWDYWGD